MIHAYILRRNIDRFRRMLEEETDGSARRAIESMIREFEGMLSMSAPERSSVDANERPQPTPEPAETLLKQKPTHAEVIDGERLAASPGKFCECNTQ